MCCLDRRFRLEQRLKSRMAPQIIEVRVGLQRTKIQPEVARLAEMMQGTLIRLAIFCHGNEVIAASFEESGENRAIFQ